MSTIRVMTYNVQRCRGGDGSVDPDRILCVIGNASPDIAALQEIDPSSCPDQLRYLAGRLGMDGYGGDLPGGNVFLSRHPLSGLRAYDLGGGASCLKADADVGGKRLHLFNVRLESFPLRRRRQVASLLGTDLLGGASLACPTLVLGDFADPGYSLKLDLHLSRTRRSLRWGTYPAPFTLWGRDRAYRRGDLKILDSSIDRSAEARQASSHLPFVLTVQVQDPRSYLRTEKSLKHRRMEIAPG